MIHVTWPPGCYGNYVIQSIWAYSNLGNNADIKIEPTGSSHGFEHWHKGFSMDHLCESTADIIISPLTGHWLDYVNNQLVKANGGNIRKHIETCFVNHKQALEGHWKDTDSIWTLREWISFWLYDTMKASYSDIKGHICTNDLYTKNVFPKLINLLGLTVMADDATMKHNQSNWIAQQRYHNSQHRCDAWVQDVLTNNNTASPCQTMLDEAYVQHCLREQGYEIRCDGLDTFPTNSSDLRELIYENSNTDNQR